MRSNNFKSASGVIVTFISLIILYYVGAIMFYRIYDTVDSPSLQGQWLAIYEGLYQFFSLGLSIYTFILIMCIMVPLLWIFIGRRGGNRI